MNLTAEQVPALRRELVEYGRSPDAAFFYTLMVNTGRQPMRPAGSPVRAGQILAATEADRLTRADLWYVDEDLCDLVDAAFPTMPTFAPRPHDLPSRHGFAVFARPLVSMIRDPIPADEVFAGMLAAMNPSPVEREALRKATHEMTTRPVGITAVSWGPIGESAVAAEAAKVWPTGGMWFSFYSMPVSVIDPTVLAGLATATGKPYQRSGPTLTVENELLISWAPEDATDLTKWEMPLDPGGTGVWGAALLTTFLLARQGNVAEQVDQRVARPERRRHERAGLGDPGAVRVLRLRRSVRERGEQQPQDGDTNPGRQYKHRWVVRGHWRRQWYPSIQAHRPKWIAPYLAGPDDAPLLGGDKVTRLTGPAS